MIDDPNAAVESARATFEEMVARATAAKTAYSSEMVGDVRTRFVELAAAVRAKPADDVPRERRKREVQDCLVDDADELSRLRAYVIPVKEIALEGRAKVGDLVDWSVPTPVTERLALETLPYLSSGDEGVARGALRTLYEVYDYWDWYTDVHASSMRRAAVVMLVLMLAALTGAVLLLYGRHLYSGLFCAGLSGAMLSVLAKLPAVMSYGETNAYWHRIYSRVAVGIAASMIGSGLLSADVISIKIPNQTNGMSVASLFNPTSTCSPAGVTPTEARPACAPGQDPNVPPQTVLLLLALAMLFAFSERALSTFESAVFPTRLAFAPSAPPGTSIKPTPPGPVTPAPPADGGPSMPLVTPPAQ